jgi:tetratricopeptide (TPR) repeat protein
VLLAEAVLGWAGVWLDDYPTPAAKDRMLGLYRRALDGLPRGRDHDALRCRLRARLAAESVHAGGPAAPLHEAVAATRTTGDRRLLAEVLALALHALFTQEHTRARVPLHDELIRTTTETGQEHLALVGLLWRTVDMLHLGDARFIRALEVLRERATALRDEQMLYHVGIVDVLVAIGRGHLDDGEVRAARCHELGGRIGRADAFAYLAAQLATMRWLQGRDVEMLDHVGEVSASPVLGDTEFSVWALAACLAARAGDHDRAHAILRHHLPPRLADLAPSGTWAAGMVALVEAATALGARDLAAQAYDLLEPHADLPAVAGLGIVCLGSIERPLGLAAGVIGRHERAVVHLERAVAANQRIVNRPLLALSRAELATALVRRPGAPPGDRDRAADLLQRAIRDGRAMGLTGRVAVWEADLAALGRPDVTGPGPARSSTPAPARATASARPAPRHGTVHRSGRGWVVALDGRRIRVRNLVGMRYLAELLTNPGKRIPAVTLADQAPGAGRPHRQEVLDERARTAYAARARELGADLAEAESANDLHRAERLRAELGLLVDELESATGLAGRPRHFPDDHERARVAVQKAIKRAVDAVEDADPALAEMLRRSVTTGLSCTYVPGADAPVSWSARAAEPAG